jgi:hypothetical protein
MSDIVITDNSWLGRGLAPYSVGSAYPLLPFPLGGPHEPNRRLVSSPRHLKHIVPISSNKLTRSLPTKVMSPTRLAGLSAVTMVGEAE